MKFMKLEDLEIGDVIKFDIDYIEKQYWAESFIEMARKHNAVISNLTNFAIYVKFILRNSEYSKEWNFSRNSPMGGVRWCEVGGVGGVGGGTI